jgi:NAD(P)-dependent dehydrogenase (short-subunit alcohol dehydrogenase family)
MSTAENLVGTGRLPGRGFDLTGKVAIVTASGANGGIGHVIALGLARLGADVVANGRTASFVEQTAEECRALGRRSIAVPGDIAEPADVGRLFEECDRAFGGLDILVNNAGIGHREHPETLTLADWDRVVRLNLTGTFLCCQEASRRMILRGGGSIVNIGSIAGALSLGRGNFVYGVTKAGIHQMTRELAVEWGHYKIRVNAILPAQIHTPRMQDLIDDPQFDHEALMRDFLHGIPLNRLGLPDEIVGPVAFLTSDAASFVTGAILPVDGGNLALNGGGSHTWPKR